MTKCPFTVVRDKSSPSKKFKSRPWAHLCIGSICFTHLGLGSAPRIPYIQNIGLRVQGLFHTTPPFRYMVVFGKTHMPTLKEKCTFEEFKFNYGGSVSHSKIVDSGLVEVRLLLEIRLHFVDH